MQHRNRSRPPFALAARAGLAIVAILAAVAPAAAAGDDHKGFFAALDFALTQPNSLDQHYANQFDFSGPSLVQTGHVVDNDSDSTIQFQVGYGFGKGLGSLRVSYWSFDSEDRQVQSLPGAVFPTVFGYGYYSAYVYSGYYGSYYSNPVALYNPTGVNVTATSAVKATTLDLDYVQPMAKGEKFSVAWLAGLRVATYEEERTFDGDDGGIYITQAKSIDSDAAGIRMGATVDFAFTKRFSLEGGIAWSLLQADSEGSAQQFVSATGGPEFRQGENENVRGEILDLTLRARWRAGPLDYYLGYTASSWDGLASDPIPPAGGGPFDAGGKREGIGFYSLTGGVLWRFGGP